MINWRDCIVPVGPRPKKEKLTKTRRHVPSTPTHCDFCMNACGHCLWSEKDVQQPVPGWDAVRYDIPFTSDRAAVYSESYVIIACPQFELQPIWADQYRAVDWEHVRRLAMKKGT